VAASIPVNSGSPDNSDSPGVTFAVDAWPEGDDLGRPCLSLRSTAHEPRHSRLRAYQAGNGPRIGKGNSSAIAKLSMLEANTCGPFVAET
jgi:hypothetical protein